jgi:hypothetical protein
MEVKRKNDALMIPYIVLCEVPIGQPPQKPKSLITTQSVIQTGLELVHPNQFRTSGQTGLPKLVYGQSAFRKSPEIQTFCIHICIDKTLI